MTLPFAGTRNARELIAWTCAIALHLAVAWLAMTRPLPAPATNDRYVAVEVVEPPPPPPPPPPQAEPEQQAPPTPPKPAVEPVDLRTPPPTDAAPREAADAEAVPVFGLSADSLGTSGGFRVRAGNTVAIRPEDSATTDVVRPLPTAELTRYPEIAARADAVYPPELRRAGIEGDVILELVIDRDGRVAEVRIVETTDPRFNEAALDAARRTRFRPAEQNGRPVPARIRFPVRFRLR